MTGTLRTHNPLFSVQRAVISCFLIIVLCCFNSLGTAEEAEVTAQNSPEIMDGADCARSCNYPSASITKKPERKWFFSIDLPFFSGVTVYKDVLYVSTHTGILEENSNLCAVDTKNGKLKWNEHIQGYASFPPFFSLDSLYVLTKPFNDIPDPDTNIITDYPGILCELNKTSGKVMQDIECRSASLNPLIAGDSIILCDGMELLSIDRYSLEENWSFSEEAGSNDFVTIPSLDPENLIILAADRGRRVSGFSFQTGERKWSFVANSYVLPYSCCRKGNFFVQTESGELMCIRSQTGEISWKVTRKKITAGFALCKDKLITCEGNKFCVLSAENGSEIFSVNTSGSVNSFPSVTGNIAYFGTDVGYVYGVDCDAGNVLWRYLLFAPVVGSPIPYDGSLYVADMKRIVYRLGEPE